MQHPNTGGLWPNKFKNKSTDPDLQGTLNLGDTSVKIVAWYTDGTGGKPKLSIRINKDKDTPQPEPEGATYNEPPKGADNDIPF